MPGGRISLLIWTLVFAFIISKANKDLGELNGKTYKIHVFLAWLLFVIHFTGFKMLGWAVGHHKLILEHFYISVGPLPAWFNLTAWVASLICSIGATILAFSLAMRKEKARIWLLRLIPIFYLVTAAEFLKGFYKSDSETVVPLLAAATISLFLVAIPFGGFYLFYLRKTVKSEIFAE